MKILNNRIDARIAALAEAIEMRKMEQEAPVDDLSKSLYEMGQELAALDEQGKAELLQSLNGNGLNLSLDDLERFITDYAEV